VRLFQATFERGRRLDGGAWGDLAAHLHRRLAEGDADGGGPALSLVDAGPPCLSPPLPRDVLGRSVERPTDAARGVHLAPDRRRLGHEADQVRPALAIARAGV